MATLNGTFKIIKEPRFFTYNSRDDGEQHSGVNLWTQEVGGKWRTALVGFSIPEEWKELAEGDEVEVIAKPGSRHNKEKNEWQTQYVIQSMVIMKAEPEDSAGDTGDTEADIPF